MTLRVEVSVNTAWNLFNFHSGLVRTLITTDYEVVAVAPYDEYAHRLSALGFGFVPLPGKPKSHK